MSLTTGSKKQTTMAHLQMPDELSRLIQDFIRPNPYKQKWDAVTKQMGDLGVHVRYDGKDAMAWGQWVNTVSDDEWDLMVTNGIALPRLIETEGDYIQDEFLGMNVSEIMVKQLWVVNTQ